MKQTVILVTLAMICGCRSDIAQQDAMELARSKGADIRISIKGDAHRVDLRRCALDGDVKSAIRNMPAIDTLLVGKAFTDADAELVEGLVSLKNLDLSRASVTAATFERLTGRWSFWPLTALLCLTTTWRLCQNCGKSKRSASLTRNVLKKLSSDLRSKTRIAPSLVDPADFVNKHGSLGLTARTFSVSGDMMHICSRLSSPHEFSMSNGVPWLTK
jgi:hypothetical protein